MGLAWNTLDLKGLLALVNAEKRGEMDGSNNVPGHSDKLSQTEDDIFSEVKEHYQDQLEISQAQVLVMETEITQCVSLTRSNGHSQTFGNEKQNWMVAKKQYFLALDVASEKYEKIAAKIRAFRIQNNILAGREPVVRTNTKLVIACLIPIFMAATEVGMNIFALAPIIGGEAITYSLLVSAINIGFAFYLGRMCITNLMHPVGTSASRLNYILGTIFIFLLIAYVNTFMAVFRGANEIALTFIGDINQMQQLMKDAVYQAVAPWNHLDKITAGSVQIMLIAITFSFFSMIDGYFFDDPINGYGKLGRSQAKAHSELTVLAKEGPKLIKDFLDQAKQTLRSKRNERHAGNKKWSLIINTFDQSLKDSFPKFNRETRTTLETAINSYRTKNKIFRTEPLPDFMTNPVDTTWIKDFVELHSSVQHHFLEDGERIKKHDENEILINKEYESTVDLYTEYFGGEMDDVFKKLRGIQLDDS